MYEEKIVENGIYGGEKEQSHSSSDKVNPAKPPFLTWKRKLNSDEITLSMFSMTWKEIIQLAPIGIRILQHIREEAAKGKRIFINPFIKHLLTSSQGIPLGGIGGGSIGTSYRGGFQRFQLFPRVWEDKQIPANQFSVSLWQEDEDKNLVIGL